MSVFTCKYRRFVALAFSGVGLPLHENVVRDRIPRVVNADEQQQQHSPGNDQQPVTQVSPNGQRRDDERHVRGEREQQMKQPVLERRLVGPLPLHAQQDGNEVGHTTDRSAAEDRSVDFPDPTRAGNGHDLGELGLQDCEDTRNPRRATDRQSPYRGATDQHAPCA